MPSGSSTTEQDAQTHSPLDKPGLPTQVALHHDHLPSPSRPEGESISSIYLEDAPSNDHMNGCSQKPLAALDDANQELSIEPIASRASVATPIHSVFTRNQKRFIVFMAAWAGFFSPVSGNIYFPALNPLAKDLNVSNTLINLTLTSYMVCNPILREFRSTRLTSVFV